MEKMIATLIVVTLGLVVVFVLISVMRGGTLGQIETFISVFSTEKRGDELTSSDYERMIKLYNKKGGFFKEFQLCTRYKGNLFDEFSEFMENNKKDEKTIYCNSIT